MSEPMRTTMLIEALLKSIELAGDHPASISIDVSAGNPTHAVVMAEPLEVRPCQDMILLVANPGLARETVPMPASLMIRLLQRSVEVVGDQFVHIRVNLGISTNNGSATGAATLLARPKATQVSPSWITILATPAT